ncbi:uncharacterized protein LOC134332600 [Trichomycterus rosablanca]|uniref:uncharacterized protein LOC134332600 n=1 Tax=Trichomycterus rosablanca TaxID=2290929 RepID=UPI002F35B192
MMEQRWEIQNPETIQQDVVMGNPCSSWHDVPEWVPQSDLCYDAQPMTNQTGQFFFNHPEMMHQADGFYYPQAGHHIDGINGHYTHVPDPAFPPYVHDLQASSAPTYFNFSEDVQFCHQEAHPEAHPIPLHNTTMVDPFTPQILHPGGMNFNSMVILDSYTPQIPQQTCSIQDMHPVPDWMPHSSLNTHIYYNHPDMLHESGSFNPTEAAAPGIDGVGVLLVPPFVEIQSNIIDPMNDHHAHVIMQSEPDSAFPLQGNGRSIRPERPENVQFINPSLGGFGEGASVKE